MEEHDTINEELSAQQAEAQETAPESTTTSNVSIVRTSTPRFQPLGAMPAKTTLPLAPTGKPVHFPVAAPDAPPVPEESGDTEKISTLSKLTPQNTAQTTTKSLTGEFLWLFEYGLDMDPVRLNRPARLNGSAFAYGPAVLHGYRLVFEGWHARTRQVRASLAATPDEPESEVWGLLYRVPRRLTQREKQQASALDTAHHAETYVVQEVRVHDAYRQREITCLTYVATSRTRQHVAQLSPAERTPDPAYVKQLVQIARRQKLPGSYIRTLEDLITPATTPLPTTPPTHTTDPLPAVLSEHDPLPMNNITQAAPQEENALGPWDVPYPVALSRWMMSFALYVCLLLLATLMLAIVQGLGILPAIFNNNFAPLGVPWYVLLYGLLGGCISCIVSLSRPRFTYPPTFVVLTWFLRPFLGAMLGALSYLVLNSGLVLLDTHPLQHFALCSLVGALAGLCEGRLLFGKPAKTPTP